jgi:hypothetical protein
LPKTGSTGENPADHGHYTHDAVMISRLHDAHHLWRQGHQTFSGFIKSRERPGKKGEKDFGRIEPKIIGGTKAENVSTPEAEKTQKNRAINPEKLEPKQKQKPRSKEIIHREKERKGIQYTQRIVPAIAFISADVPA